MISSQVFRIRHNFSHSFPNERRAVVRVRFPDIFRTVLLRLLQVPCQEPFYGNINVYRCFIFLIKTNLKDLNTGNPEDVLNFTLRDTTLDLLYICNAVHTKRGIFQPPLICKIRFRTCRNNIFQPNYRGKPKNRFAISRMNEGWDFESRI